MNLPKTREQSIESVRAALKQSELDRLKVIAKDEDYKEWIREKFKPKKKK